MTNKVEITHNHVRRAAKLAGLIAYRSRPRGEYMLFDRLTNAVVAGSFRHPLSAEEALLWIERLDDRDPG